MIEASAALGALAQETRLAIFRFLVERGPAGTPVGTMADHFGLPGATLSFHLNALKQSGLVSMRRAGRSLIYAPDFARMNSLLGFLMEDCCGGACTPAKPSTGKRRK